MVGRSGSKPAYRREQCFGRLLHNMSLSLMNLTLRHTGPNARRSSPKFETSQIVDAVGRSQEPRPPPTACASQRTPRFCYLFLPRTSAFVVLTMGATAALLSSLGTTFASMAPSQAVSIKEQDPLARACVQISLYHIATIMVLRALTHTLLRESQVVQKQIHQHALRNVTQPLPIPTQTSHRTSTLSMERWSVQAERKLSSRW
mmetsp:Transcript_42164/g.80675  ORF Transcript_42164/g.80675 Transcript_42164/m.80675 type:complete len:203 (+) Transcript_42164:134-742(+)